MLAGLTAGTASLLTSCGTIIYPDRVNQKARGDLDPLILGLDAVGLFFFLIPGIIAFAVDFGTGAIYYPAHRHGREETIFDKAEAKNRLDRQEIERMASLRAGRPVSLEAEGVQAMRIDSLDQFWGAYSRLAESAMIASI